MDWIEPKTTWGYGDKLHPSDLNTIGNDLRYLKEQGVGNATPGEKGDKGDIGPKGNDGPPGPHGLKGDPGVHGPQGMQGSQGQQGIQGIPGSKGDTGEQGPRGLQGPQGNKGDKGDTGEQGPRGFTGEEGPEGPIGPQGPHGGPQGPEGPKGERGYAGPIGPKGDQGIQGPIGPKGDPGVAINKYDKLAIVCVAGQSNAVGYDESPVDPRFTYKNINDNRILQLGFRDPDNLKLIPMGHCAHSYQDMTYTNNPNTSNFKGTKGIHLPLGNLLLSQIPDDYAVCFISCSFGGTAFTKGTEGTFDINTLKPSTDAKRWGINGGMYKAMKARIKHTLDLNTDNLFLGVVWCQGEHDADIALAGHNSGFTAMTDDFFNYFNNTEAGKYKNRVKKQIWDKDIWYTYETVAHWYNTGNANCTELWKFYETWNPANYVAIPRNTESNAINGTGGTSSTRPSHFGNNAYYNVVAPAVYKKLIENNSLFKKEV